ncbi:antitoxin VbhA family protein [Variovorax sp. PvP013]|uniref:antitoxin VbhA family protein n=1 Tax=Variovorax sp. PvP013 TaxID=3156435 RepID=UPI003D1BFF1D
MTANSPPSDDFADLRLKRKQAIDFARASVELSGFKITQDEEARAQRFIDGEITLTEFVGAPGKC